MPQPDHVKKYLVESNPRRHGKSTLASLIMRAHEVSVRDNIVHACLTATPGHGCDALSLLDAMVDAVEILADERRRLFNDLVMLESRRGPRT